MVVERAQPEQFVTPERWQQVDCLLNEALEHPPEERSSFLARACAGDEELQKEVESLLGFHGQADNPIETPPMDVAADWLRATEARAGTSIAHYRLIREVGRGGMGVVYLADDSRLGRQVAIKLLLSPLMMDDARIRRFHQEARAASALNHPNIITIYEVGRTPKEAGTASFIVAEFVEGRTIRQLCHHGGMSLAAAIDLLIQVTAALAAAHQAGIVHRDIKPENIMQRPDGIVKVLDFGLAKLGEQGMNTAEGSFAPVTTQTGMIMGTVSYMSPEQARGLEVDHRSDLFSLGAVMYELLTGHEPFPGETSQDVLVSLLSEEPSPISRFVTGLPQALQDVVNKALAKPIAERYQSASEMGDALRKIREDLEFAARLRVRSGEDEDVLSKMVGARSKESALSFGTNGGAAGHSTVSSSTPPGLRWAALTKGIRRNGRKLTAGAALVLISLLVWRQLASNAGTTNQLAVLPIINESGDAKLDYLSDSLTEGMIDGLSQLPGMVVTGRSTVMAYKGRLVDPRVAGKDLKVGALVTARLVQSESKPVLRVEMLKTGDGSRMWGSSYPVRQDELLALQQKISGEISQALHLSVSGDRQIELARRHSHNSEAYRLYMIGRSYWNKRTVEATRKAIDSFEKAIEKDPQYALAYVGLADAYSTLGSYRLMSGAEAMPKAMEAVDKALKLDNQLAEAHASLGKILTDFDWDWTSAEREFKLAISLQPNYANAHHWYSTLLSNLGRVDEAVSEIDRARDLEMFSPATNTQVGGVLYRARRFDEAIVSLRQTLEVEPTFLAARLYLGLCLTFQGRYDEALSESRKALEISPNSPDAEALFGYISGRAGHKKDALEALAELERRAQRGYVAPSAFAAVYNGLGDKDNAFKFLERCFDDRNPSIRGLKTEAVYDSLRNDDRFTALLRRAGFAQ